MNKKIRIAEDATVNLGSASAEETQALAARLSALCGPGDCILLRGELGAGKTAFARGFIGARLGKPEEIVSPTFTLVQTYPTRDGHTIWHFDLYRLRRPEEAIEIGLEEALVAGITLVEWPELMKGRFGPAALEVRIAYTGEEDRRRLTFTGAGAHWADRLAALEEPG